MPAALSRVANLKRCAELYAKAKRLAPFLPAPVSPDPPKASWIREYEADRASPCILEIKESDLPDDFLRTLVLVFVNGNPIYFTARQYYGDATVHLPKLNMLRSDFRFRWTYRFYNFIHITWDS